MPSALPALWILAIPRRPATPTTRGLRGLGWVHVVCAAPAVAPQPILVMRHIPALVVPRSMVLRMVLLVLPVRVMPATPMMPVSVVFGVPVMPGMMMMSLPPAVPGPANWLVEVVCPCARSPECEADKPTEEPDA